MKLSGKTILITGGARRVGRAIALAAAREGADILLHYGKSSQEAASAVAEIQTLGRHAWAFSCDLADLGQVESLVERAWDIQPFSILVNNASIFESLDWKTTNRENWQRHMDINLTAPFFLSQAFAKKLSPANPGRIINLLDWRSLRPGSDHLPYTISKAALAALTKSLATALAPNITVNGLALGAILPPSDGGGNDQEILSPVPAQRWADLKEVTDAILFLMTGPRYITGEILHLDGGRHLV